MEVKSVRRDHEFGARNCRDDVECCQSECPKRWMSAIREKKISGVVESVPRGERVVTGADVSGHVGEGNRGVG